MPVGHGDRLGRLAQVMEVAERVQDARLRHALEKNGRWAHRVREAVLDWLYRGCRSSFESTPYEERVRSMKMRRLASIAGLSVCLLGLGTSFTAAQDPSPASAPEAAAAARRGFDPARRVPQYFGQVGLTPEQKEAIYKIRAKHYEKIAALERELAELRAQELKECEAVLTESQKQLLAQRRRPSIRGQARPAAAPVPPAAAPASPSS
jgi:Spy/CpxP family protein refolding chaperone